jgi:transcription antitermination factor NusG
LPWYGILVRSQCEFRADEELRMRGFESLLPLHKVRRRWSDRMKTLEVPVFPGYLFCRFDLSHRVRILSSPGVARILGAGATPIPICETEIGSIRTMLKSSLALTPWPYIPAGRRVRIDRGPLAGVEGTIIHADAGQPRVVVSVTLLQRAVSVQVERDWISAG